MSNTLAQRIRQAALNYLARREHAPQELQFKLAQKGFAEADIQPVLRQLEAENLLSVTRFTESFVRSRLNRGHGPYKIAQELRQRGISEAEWQNYINVLGFDWIQQAIAVRQQRFGESLPQTPQDTLKQSRFLQSRGFSGEQIKVALRTNLGTEDD